MAPLLSCAAFSLNDSTRDVVEAVLARSSAAGRLALTQKCPHANALSYARTHIFTCARARADTLADYALHLGNRAAALAPDDPFVLATMGGLLLSADRDPATAGMFAEVPVRVYEGESERGVGNSV